MADALKAFAKYLDRVDQVVKQVADVSLSEIGDRFTALAGRYREALAQANLKAETLVALQREGKGLVQEWESASTGCSRAFSVVPASRGCGPDGNRFRRSPDCIFTRCAQPTSWHSG